MEPRLDDPTGRRDQCAARDVDTSAMGEHRSAETINPVERIACHTLTLVALIHPLAELSILRVRSDASRGQRDACSPADSGAFARSRAAVCLQDGSIPHANATVPAERPRRSEAVQVFGRDALWIGWTGRPRCCRLAAFWSLSRERTRGSARPHRLRADRVLQCGTGRSHSLCFRFPAAPAPARPRGNTWRSRAIGGGAPRQRPTGRIP